MAQRLKGIPVMPGLGLGYAVILKSTLPPEIDERILPGDVGEELKKFQDAVNQACRSLEQIRDEAAKKAGDQEAAIFEAQLLMLQGPCWIWWSRRSGVTCLEPFPPAGRLAKKTQPCSAHWKIPILPPEPGMCWMCGTISCVV